MSIQESLMNHGNGEFAERLTYETKYDADDEDVDDEEVDYEEGTADDEEGTADDEEGTADDEEGTADDEEDDDEEVEEDNEEDWINDYARILPQSFNIEYKMCTEVEQYSNTGIDDYDYYLNCKN